MGPVKCPGWDLGECSRAPGPVGSNNIRSGVSGEVREDPSRRAFSLGSHRRRGLVQHLVLIMLALFCAEKNVHQNLGKGKRSEVDAKCSRQVINVRCPRSDHVLKGSPSFLPSVQISLKPSNNNTRYYPSHHIRRPLAHRFSHGRARVLRGYFQDVFTMAVLPRSHDTPFSPPLGRCDKSRICACTPGNNNSISRRQTSDLGALRPP